MKPKYRLPLLMLITFLMASNALLFIASPQSSFIGSAQESTSKYQEENSTPPIFESGQQYSISEQGWTAWSGVSSGLPAMSYGNRSDVFDNNQIRYFQSNSSTSSTSVSVPMGTGWEGHELFVGLTDLTENRTWVQDPDLENDPASWTYDNTGDASASWLKVQLSLLLSR